MINCKHPPNQEGIHRRMLVMDFTHSGWDVHAWCASCGQRTESVRVPWKEECFAQVVAVGGMLNGWLWPSESFPEPELTHECRWAHHKRCTGQALRSGVDCTCHCHIKVAS